MIEIVVAFYRLFLRKVRTFDDITACSLQRKAVSLISSTYDLKKEQVKFFHTESRTHDRCVGIAIIRYRSTKPFHHRATSAHQGNNNSSHRTQKKLQFNLT
ncbi:hypothetical protein ACKWTF_004745 [Chironomus riparius]